jgi:hypothetical protein
LCSKAKTPTTMIKTNFILGLFIFITFVSCDKESNKTDLSLDKYYQLTVTRNDKVYQIFKFNNYNLLNQLNYDTLGVIKEKIYFTYSSQKIKKDFYNKDSVLLSYQIYLLNKNNTIDSIFTYNQPSELSDSKHACIFTYNKLGVLNVIMDKLFTTGDHLDVNFKWLENNVIEKYFPISSGFPQYSYEYDDKPSIYKLIKAPIDVNFGTRAVAEIPISTNNIKRINVKELVNNDFTFDTVKYELYNSQMTYDNNGYLRTEIRKYNNASVKFDYKLDTIK